MVRLCSRNLEMLKRVSGRWKLNGSSCGRGEGRRGEGRELDSRVRAQVGREAGAEL